MISILKTKHICQHNEIWCNFNLLFSPIQEPVIVTKKVPPHMPSNICQNYVPLVCPKLIYIGSSNNCHEAFGVGLI
jgi:hypothetical protein